MYRLYLFDDNMIVYTAAKGKTPALCRELGAKFLFKVHGDRLYFSTDEGVQKEGHVNDEGKYIQGDVDSDYNSEYKFKSGRDVQKMLEALVLIKNTPSEYIPTLVNIIEEKDITKEWQKNKVATALFKRLKEIE